MVQTDGRGDEIEDWQDDNGTDGRGDEIEDWQDDNDLIIIDDLYWQ